MPDSAPRSSYLTVPEAAAYLAVHPLTIRRMIGRGMLSPQRLPAWRHSKILIPVEQIERLRASEALA